MPRSSCRHLRLLVSQPKEPRSIPATAGDGERDLREAGIGVAAPGEAVGKYGDLVHPTIPFATENGAGPNLGAPPGRTQGAPCSFLWRFGMIEQTPILVIKIAVPVALQPVRHHAEQKMARKVMGWGPPEHGMPTAAKLPDVEIAQSSDRYPWHRDQAGRRRAARTLGLPPSLLLIW
jgi:hypothetical protein